MKRLKALWSLMRCTNYLLVTHDLDRAGELLNTKYKHNMPELEAKATIAVMYCHTKANETIAEVSEILARSAVGKK